MSDGVVTVQGEVKSVRKFDSGWTIVKIDQPGKAGSLLDSSLTLVGTMPELTEGMSVTVRGRHTNHDKFGPQFKVSEVLESGYSGNQGIARYLAGEDFPDVGDVTASAIVAHFGADTLSILDDDPSRVFEVEGVPRRRLEQVATKWHESRQKHRELSELLALGISPGLANRVIRHFGEGVAEAKVKSDPYSLADVHGFGFRRADEVAMRVGVMPDSPARAKAATLYTIREAEANGHCYIERDDLAKKVEELTGVPSHKVGSALMSLASEDRVVIENGEETMVFTAELHHAETEVADSLRSLLDYGEGAEYYADDAALMADLREFASLPEDFVPDESQIEAVMAALNKRVVVITGGPGTGKSTISKAVVALLEHQGLSVSLCSPTGRAAKRLGETTGRPASTIHRLLEYSPQVNGFKRNAANPLGVDVVLVDEFSMVDIRLFRDLIRAMERNDRLILVGDADQLPSVGPGNVLRDLIKSGAVPVVRLRHIHRQAQGNTIVQVAHDVLHGVAPSLPVPRERGDKNCVFVGVGGQGELEEYLLLLITRELPKLVKSDKSPVTPRDIQVLTPRRRGKYSVEELNPILQSSLNPPATGKEELRDGDRIFRVGDRVMQMKNNYNLGDNGVFNGDVGYVSAVRRSADGSSISVKYPDMRDPVDYAEDIFNQIQHAYIQTVHKAQGSEVPVLIFLLFNAHGIMLQRNLVYTGITRAKQMCVVMGEEDAFAKAVRNDREVRRNTSLKQKLQKS